MGKTSFNQRCKKSLVNYFRAIFFGLVVILFSQESFAKGFPSLPGISKETNTKTDQNTPTPITVNGDLVEYSTDAREVTATGNVEVIHKGAKLNCQKLTVNTQTKDAKAEGGVRLEDELGIIEGSSMTYNFETKVGVMFDSKFKANPYFGKAKKIDKVSDTEFLVLRGYCTTCNFDHPHYRIGSKKMDMFPGDKIRTKGDSLYIADVPVAYLPQYNHSLQDNNSHVQVMPGKSKDWGAYVLSTWRYNLNQYIDGRLYFDVRSKLGLAEGVGANYTTPGFGKGDIKYYFSKEKPGDLPSNYPTGQQTRFDRYLVRLRHKWDVDQQTNVVAEFYKIKDDRRKYFDPTSNIFKDYFYREYEKDSQPFTYALLHHNFTRGTLDFTLQKRTNHWFDQIEKLPEAKYSLANIRMGESPFYFENISSLGTFNKRATTEIPTSNEQSLTRLDSTNKISLPMKVAFISFTPFVSNRETFYDKGPNGQDLPIRTIFSSGSDLSTKFYRLFNVNSDFLGMDINGLRHIITPSVAYSYNHTPTIPALNLKQLDEIDSVGPSHTASLSLSNKLQTKRKGQSIDMVDFLITTPYNFKPKNGDRHGSHFSDVFFQLKLIPYSWMRFEGDATYTRSGSRSADNFNTLSALNGDLSIDMGRWGSFGIGERYLRKGSKQLTYNYKVKLNPKWSFYIYQRRERGHGVDINRGLKEHEYTLSRDMHCWTMDVTYNGRKGHGSTIWIIFRLKAFPENEFGFNQSYHTPKSGSPRNE